MTLYITGFGCGSREGMTYEAAQAISACETVVGYTTYTEIISEYFPDKEYISTGMRKESERVRLALELAEKKDTALICSGDAELYGMAGLAYELNRDYDADIKVTAGVSAAFSGGAVLGSPLTHDTALISLSDLLTPAEVIEKRLRCAAQGDFVTVLYNPASKSRREHLRRACEIMLECRSPETVCGYVRNIGREGQESGIMTLEELKDFEADMFTTVYIGNSQTKVIDGKMVTPRGYRDV
ncbi:MAG: precorrin-3B C(17)-methyltransferase [Ruminococcus sp.]|nr:precorrin-3B C(17)-methyltransferase [Ruminococcus sp.]